MITSGAGRRARTFAVTGVTVIAAGMAAIGCARQAPKVALPPHPVRSTPASQRPAGSSSPAKTGSHRPAGPRSHAPGQTHSPTAEPARDRSPGPVASPAPVTSHRPPASSPPPPVPIGSARSPRELIPASGAYLGAYIQPSSYTSAAEIAALKSFQRSVGGQIAIVHDYHPWENMFPNPEDRFVVRSGKVLLLTWSGTPDTRKIIAGDYDSLIRERARAVRRLGHPILLEFRHEMDRPNLQWAVHGPKDYIAAWDHIRAIFRQVGATNVGWVWCPTGYGFQQGRAQPFYPGNNEVDWVCADIYSPAASQSLRQVALPFLNWARHTGKPVLIGEFAVDGTPSAWARWLTAAGQLARRDHQIKGMLYFDANGTDSNGHPFSYWLGKNKRALAAFGRLLTWHIFHPALWPGA